MVTEAPFECQHFHSGARVATQQGNNSPKFLDALQDPLARATATRQMKVEWQTSVRNHTPGGTVPPSLLSPTVFGDPKSHQGPFFFLHRTRAFTPPAPCRTCVYFARISCGQMLGVSAEKGPPAEGVWWPKQREQHAAVKTQKDSP